MTSSNKIIDSNSARRVVVADSSSGRNGARPTRVNGVRRKSYADWITRAIQSSHEGKMSLAGIYNWMAANVPGLYEKRNLHSSKGWKNAVRHTLSVNRRFQKSSQPNVRAALWSIVAASDSDSSDTPQPEEGPSSLINTGPGPNSRYSGLYGPSEFQSSSSGLLTGSIPVTTCVSTPCIRSSSAPTSSASELDTDNELVRAPMMTQTLELHHQDGTVRTVTVPKLLPVHVVGDYRLVTVEPKLSTTLVVTSGSS